MNERWRPISIVQSCLRWAYRARSFIFPDNENEERVTNAVIRPCRWEQSVDAIIDNVRQRETPVTYCVIETQLEIRCRRNGRLIYGLRVFSFVHVFVCFLRLEVVFLHPVLKHKKKLRENWTCMWKSYEILEKEGYKPHIDFTYSHLCKTQSLYWGFAS